MVDSKIKDLSEKTTGAASDEFVINDVAGGNVDKKMGMDGLRITESQVTDLGTYMTASSTNTLTNKTFNANGTGNSITNIENADISATAAIAYSKLNLSSSVVATTDLTATGTKNSTTFLRGDDTWATPTATVAALNDITNVTITANSAGEILKWSGTAWINNTLTEAGIAAATHTHTESDITDLGSYITASSTDTLTNKTIDQDGVGNSITNIANASIKAAAGIVYSKLNLTNSIVLGDLTTAAKTTSFIISASDETTALTTGTAKATFRMPFAFTLTAVRATLTTAGTGANLVTVDINETGTSVLSTKITIDATEKTSETAATAPVISDTALSDDAEITIDIDQIDSGGVSAGLKVYLIGYPT